MTILNFNMHGCLHRGDERSPATLRQPAVSTPVSAGSTNTFATMARNSRSSRKSELEKNDHTYFDVGTPEPVNHLHHLTPVETVPYLVKSQFVKAMMAEFLAMFVTMLFGFCCMLQTVLSSGTDGSFVTIALCWGLAFFFGITIAGGVSGSHLNPAITTTLALLGMLPWKQVPFYILSQLLGAYVASFFAYILYRPMLNELDPNRMTTHTIFATYPHENVGNFTCFATEVVATALLVMGILALLDHHNRPIGEKAAPAAIGALVSTIAMGFAMNSGLAMNPARDLGPRLFIWSAGWGSRVFSLNHYYFWVPIVAPILGGAVGAFIYEGMIGYHHAEKSRGPPPEYRF